MGGCTLLRQKVVRAGFRRSTGTATFRCVEIDRVRSVASPAVHVPEQRGVSGALADARAKLREASPPDRWDGVLSEVSRIQVERKTSMLDAMHVVLGKLAAGWTPPPG